MEPNDNSELQIKKDANVLYLEPGASYPPSWQDIKSIVQAVFGKRHRQSNDAIDFTKEILEKLDAYGVNNPQFDVQSQSLGTQNSIVSCCYLESKGINYRLVQHEPISPNAALENLPKEISDDQGFLDRIATALKTKTISLLVYPHTLAITIDLLGLCIMFLPHIL